MPGLGKDAKKGEKEKEGRKAKRNNQRQQDARSLGPIAQKKDEELVESDSKWERHTGKEE